MVGACEVAKILQNNVRGSGVKNPYRLVILDSCNGSSRDWADAFGIVGFPQADTVANYFTKYHIDPQAFVAYRVQAPAPCWTSDIPVVQNALNTFFVEWQLGFPLNVCMQNYTDQLVAYGSPFTSDRYSVIHSGYPNHNDKQPDGIPDIKQYRISGCVDLTTFDR
jgi:hypothetical protein